jgi:hypothetical protein
MRKTSTPYARKVRQFKHLAKQLNRLLESGQFHELSDSRREGLVCKLRRLYRKLNAFFSSGYLRKALAGAALLLGMSQAAQAQTFGPEVVTPFNFQNSLYFNFPTFVDIDNDGDLDLLEAGVVYYGDLKLYFFENTGSSEEPNFAAPVESPFGIDDTYVLTPTFADIDGDGDQDLIMGSLDYYQSGNLIFRENTGTAESPAFGPSQLNPFGLTPTYYISFPKLVDIDNDGDFDLFVSEYYATLLFFENTGTAQAPSFAAPVANPFGIQPPISADAYFRTFDFADVDNDGDQDLIQHFYDFTQADSRVYYQENTGTAEAPAFGTPVQEPFGIFFDGWYFIQPAFADIDNDGDPDLFVGTYYDYGGLSFFQNLLLETNTAETGLEADVALFPNPASGITNLKLAFPEAPGELEITLTDIHGRTQRQWQLDGVAERFETQLDLSGLSPGMHFVRLRSGERFATVRVMLE